ncbi:MAG: sodium:calcium symporter [Bacteroidota bacterium]
MSLNNSPLFPYEAIFFYLITLAINVYILSRGLRGGIELVAKYGVPLLIFFGIFLAIKSIFIKEGINGAVNDGTTGLNFLWAPNYESMWNPKVWLAAAGQIFFTIGVGWGTIHCYSSYLSSRDDIALSSMSAGWTNEFVEVVLGASIIIPLSVGFLGIERVTELAELGGLALGFKTMPYLFSKWQPFIAAMAGSMWFGLLFIAGITSSMAMGSPFMSLMQDEFNWSRNKAALTFGIIALTLGLPTVLFFNYGVFDQYDYWSGTFALFLFAMLEIIFYSWVIGVNKGWKEIQKGADIQLSVIFKYILKFITPLLLSLVFLASLIKPVNSNWIGAFSRLFEGEKWELDNTSIIKQLSSTGLQEKIAATQDLAAKAELEKQLFLINATKILLLLVFVAICILVHIATKRQQKQKET